VDKTLYLVVYQDTFVKNCYRFIQHLQ